MKPINESIICSGFGGQGVMVLGKFLATAGMTETLNVTCIPSYGAEVRGGTAHSAVRISAEPIGDPTVFMASAVVIMNKPSLYRFLSRILPGGLLILNTSMVDVVPERGDITTVAAPLTDLALEIGNIKVANMIAAGIYAGKKKIFRKETLISVIEMMGRGREEIIPANIKAIEKGMEIGFRG